MGNKRIKFQLDERKQPENVDNIAEETRNVQKNDAA